MRELTEKEFKEFQDNYYDTRIVELIDKDELPVKVMTRKIPTTDENVAITFSLGYYNEPGIDYYFITADSHDLEKNYIFGREVMGVFIDEKGTADRYFPMKKIQKAILDILNNGR